MTLSNASSTAPRRLVFAALLLFSSSLLAAPADVRRVEKMASAAQQAYAAGRFEESVRLLEDAYGISPLPKLLYNLARALERAQRTGEAIQTYRRYLDSPGRDPVLARKAADAYEALVSAEARQSEADRERHLAERERQLTEREALARTQRETEARQAEELERARAEEADRRLKAEASARQQQLAAQAAAVEAASEPARSRRLVGWSVAAVGVAGLAAGGTFGALAWQDRAAFAASVDENKGALAASARTKAIVADAALGLGAVLVTVGLVVVTKAPAASGATTAGIAFVPAVDGSGAVPTVTLAGRFER
jgi:hypothetical protein